MTSLAKLGALLEEIEREGTSVIELVRAGRPQEPWVLYPDEEGVFDPGTRSQFYFHAHANALHEAGHFHTVRLFDDRTAHLVGISMAHTGWPQALFTLNLWAIGDADETPENLKRYARQFRLDEGRGEARVVRFVNLVFEVFLPEIEWLQNEKERALTTHRRAHPHANPFEDRSLEVLSRVEIDVRDRLARRAPARRAPR